MAAFKYWDKTCPHCDKKFVQISSLSIKKYYSKSTKEGKKTSSKTKNVTIIVSIVHQISLAKFAFNLSEIAYKYNCEYCSAKFATLLSTTERC